MESQTPQIDTTLTNYGDKNENSNILKALADGIIEASSEYVSVFTDASKLAEGQVGFGVIIRQRSLPDCVISLRLNDNITIYKAELFAIYYSLLYVASQYSLKKISVYSDSLSSVTSIATCSSTANPTILNNILSIITLNKLQVRVTWIPSHIGISGNERADAATLEAASREKIDISLPYERLEIQNIVDTITARDVDEWWKGVSSFYSRIAPRWAGCYHSMAENRAAGAVVGWFLNLQGGSGYMAFYCAASLV